MRLGADRLSSIIEEKILEILGPVVSLGGTPTIRRRGAVVRFLKRRRWPPQTRRVDDSAVSRFRIHRDDQEVQHSE
jgi:hypothetical protein